MSSRNHLLPWSALLLAGLTGGAACVPGLQPGDGMPTGGALASGNGGVGVIAAGGSGGVFIATGGSGGSFIVDDGLGNGAASGQCSGLASGGAVTFAFCPFWLGDSSYGSNSGSVDVTCDRAEGGQGGASSTLPALRRLCENGSKPNFAGAQEVALCLDTLDEDPCGAYHEANVNSCVQQLAACNLDPAAVGCTPLFADCPTLNRSICYWGMASATDREYIFECFDEPVQGESCDNRFLRCAWGL